MRRVFIITVTLTLFLTGCSALDVVGKDAIRAFGDLLVVLPAEENGADGWRITAPDKSAWFDWDNQSVSMTVDAQPFVSAGMDPNKLENGIVGGNNLVFFSPAFNMLNQNAQSGPLEQFEKNAGFLREHVGYHMGMDHYNISLGSGNMFEWAKNLDINESDIVFVLNPDPLIAAGVQPDSVDGWIYAKVAVHINGRPADEWKFLKPFELLS